MKPFILLGLLFALPAVGLSESRRIYRTYESPRVTTVRTTTIAPSYEVYRTWDTTRDYRWNDRVYRWDGSTWGVIYTGRGGFGPSPTLQDDVGETRTPDRVVTRITRTVPAVDVVPASTLAIDVQRNLARRGYYHGPIDGMVGPGTRSAIAAFQADHGMDPNGYITRDLEIRLGL